MKTLIYHGPGDVRVKNDRIKVDDWVCLPFNVACGFCKNFERGLTGACLFANPGTTGAAYGFAGMRPYSGGQAEYLRVPYADFNCLKLPDDVRDNGWTKVVLHPAGTASSTKRSATVK